MKRAGRVERYLFRFFFASGLRRIQFPSSGKVYARKAFCRFCSHQEHQVSIPFKREGVLRENIFAQPVRTLFVSIPFKREGVLQDPVTVLLCKTYGKVSIPFKREGVLQVEDSMMEELHDLQSFNSLQTGRCVARDPFLHLVGTRVRTLQNPTRTARCFFSLKICG